MSDDENEMAALRNSKRFQSSMHLKPKEKIVEPKEDNISDIKNPLITKDDDFKVPLPQAPHKHMHNNKPTIHDNQDSLLN